MSAPVIRQHDSEPVPGLPQRLPEGERILWQGRPSQRRIATDVLKANWIAIYFAVLIAWALAAGWSDGRPVPAILFSAGVLCILGAVLVGLVELYAWGVTRTTLYTITNRRIVMRVGVGSSITLNLPYGRVAAASMVERKDGSGDIVFEVAEGVRLSWFHLWPHVRPRHYAKPQAALRCIPAVAGVAALVVHELSAAQQAVTGEAVPELSPAIPVRRRSPAQAANSQPAHA
jgi:Bacterial PH domain